MPLVTSTQRIKILHAHPPPKDLQGLRIVHPKIKIPYDRAGSSAVVPYHEYRPPRDQDPQLVLTGLSAAQAQERDPAPGIKIPTQTGQEH